MLTQKRRKGIVGDIRQRMQMYYDKMPEPKGPIGNFCLFWAGFTVQRLLEEGLDARLQAGTCSWKRIKEGEDTGKDDCMTEWGYWFQLNQKTIQDIINGQLPEMHVWAAIINHQIPEKSEIIDLTTGYFKERCIRDGYPWTAEYEPPPYLWVRCDEMPTVASYHPDQKACEIAYQYWRNVMNGNTFMFFTF